MGPSRANAPNGAAVPGPGDRGRGPRRAGLAALFRGRRRGRLRWALVMAVLAALPAVFVVALSDDNAHTRVTAEYVPVENWDTGFKSLYILRNTGDEPAHGWTLRFRLAPGSEISRVWNGRLDGEGGLYTVRGDGELGPGKSVDVTIEVRRGDTHAPPEIPTDCTIDNRPCAVAGTAGAANGARAPMPSQQSTPGVPTESERRGSGKPTTDTTSQGPLVPPAPATPPPGTVPTPRPGGSTAVRVSPYIDVSAPGPYDLAGALRTTGVRDWTLAFVVDSGDCTPSWGGGMRLNDPAVVQRVNELRTLGGDIGISFGGSAVTDLAASCTTPEALAAAYLKVVDSYQLTRVDLYVDGRSLGRRDIVERRNQALAIVVDAVHRKGGTLNITYSLPVTPTGFGDDALALLRDAGTRGIPVAYVNLLAMDYGSAIAPDPAGRMGRYAMDAARTVHEQLRSLWPALADEQVWQRISVTPMIGTDDVPGEVFTLEDARQLARFAAEQHVGRLSWWSAGRDRPCGTGAGLVMADPACSGVAQSPESYLGAFTSPPPAGD
ncbi:glycoside hydrolase family 18 protein [Yinghuangia seranimata]|uniref:glycoside hydrolase family 18 protein n=1 Tax=Yinghuangia seranimata TaxID=408067 RepID=UPI00248AF4DE|nr:cellulose binding domain-containing protein [Yinghuangia seranimata]MDI2128931.1 cellulose binding domain-containing protein [Yinghuangia seranimata]